MLAFCLTSCAKKVDKEIKSDHLLSQHVHLDVVDLLSSPDRVELFEMTLPFKKMANSLGEYGISKQLEDVNMQVWSEIQSLLISEEYYILTPMKKCLFVPQKALVLHKGDQELQLLMSFSCKQLRFQYKDVVFVVSFDPAMEQLKELIR
jgi:hypothetical protein